MVVEKGSDVGAHILSGAVIDPVGLDALVPCWREEADTPLTEPVISKSRATPRSRPRPKPCRHSNPVSSTLPPAYVNNWTAFGAGSPSSATWRRGGWPRRLHRRRSLSE